MPWHAPDDDNDDHAPPSPALFLEADVLDPSAAYEQRDKEDHQLRLLR